MELNMADVHEQKADTETKFFGTTITILTKAAYSKREVKHNLKNTLVDYLHKQNTRHTYHNAVNNNALPVRYRVRTTQYGGKHRLSSIGGNHGLQFVATEAKTLTPGQLRSYIQLVATGWLSSMVHSCHP
jgi:hypothetical protein